VFSTPVYFPNGVVRHSMTDKITKVRAVADAGDTDKAAKMLRWLLQNEPSADAWVLAAEWATDADQQRAYLRKALQLDEWHTQANRLLYKLEGAKPTQEMEAVTLAKDEWARTTGTKPVREIVDAPRRVDRFQKQAQRQRFWTRLGCLSAIVFSMSLSIFVFRVFGFINSGALSGIGALFGNPTPVAAIQGTPFAEVAQPYLYMTPSHVEKAVAQDMEILDDGYMHEHFFQANAGQEYAVYVQFLSVNANHVSRNMVVLDPDRQNAMDRCVSGRILEGDNNITLICAIDKSGTWRVRIVGRNTESVGAYFVGVENMEF
jgi:hypothetical protein